MGLNISAWFFSSTKQPFIKKLLDQAFGEIDKELFNRFIGAVTSELIEIEEKLEDFQIKISNLDKKVYFAGEIYDPYQQMGVPGAILSGYSLLINY